MAAIVGDSVEGIENMVLKITFPLTRVRRAVINRGNPTAKISVPATQYAVFLSAFPGYGAGITAIEENDRIEDNLFRLEEENM